nr:TlpA disulfide reductase family protein [Lachnoclostridium sp. An169]
MNNITGYLSTVQQAESEGGDTAGTENVADTESAGQQESSAESQTDENSAAASQTENEENQSGNADGSSEENRTKAYDFTLTDQYGNTHTLSDYEGKVIFLNFWGTWCPPCRAEMPDIQKLYEEYASQGDDAEVVILGAAAPGMGQEGSKEEITSFMEENGYTYPVLMDETYEMFNWYGITAFPTTFMIDREGYVYGYVSGQMTEDIMRSIIDQTLSGGK